MVDENDSPAPRSSKIELDDRINTVLDMILRGANRRFLIQFGAKRWGISTRMVDKYIRMARESVIEEQREERHGIYAQAVARMKKLLMKNADGDQKTVLEICKELHKLQGAYPAEKQEVKVTGGLVSQLTDEELDRAIAAAELDKKEDAPENGDPED